MFCAASVAPPAVADGDLPMLAFLSFPVSSLLMCAAAIRRTGFFVFHGIPNPAFSALPTLCFHHFLVFFDFSTSAVPPRRVPYRQVEPVTQGTSPPLGRMVCPSFPVPHGFSPWAPAWQELYVSQAVKCRGAGGGILRRHLLSLPRGRGPSQTPKFLSPGPPSPWLPALLPVNKQKPLVVQVPSGFKPGDARGGAPCIKTTLSLPLPRRGRALCERGSGGYPSPSGKGGQKGKQKAWSAGDQKDKPPAGHRNRKNPPPHKTTAASTKKSTILLTDTVICAILFQQF